MQDLKIVNFLNNEGEQFHDVKGISGWTWKYEFLAFSSVKYRAFFFFPVLTVGVCIWNAIPPWVG